MYNNSGYNDNKNVLEISVDSDKLEENRKYLEFLN